MDSPAKADSRLAMVLISGRCWVVIKTPVIDKDEQVVAIRGKVSNVMVQPNDKRKEVLDAIQFLKNKENKTKADKEKIQMLEVILKTV